MSYTDSEANGDVKKEKETYLHLTESLRSSPDNIKNRDYLDSEEESMCIIHTPIEKLCSIYTTCVYAMNYLLTQYFFCSTVIYEVP